MALPGVSINVKDGAMGAMGASATGSFAAVGVAANFGQGILTFTDAEQAEAALGDGPLRDLIVSALSVAKTTVYAIALEGSVPGTLSAVVAGNANTGTGSITAAGSPRNEYDVAVEILSSGTLNEAVFRVVVDGLYDVINIDLRVPIEERNKVSMFAGVLNAGFGAFDREGGAGFAVSPAWKEETKYRNFGGVIKGKVMSVEHDITMGIMTIGVTKL